MKIRICDRCRKEIGNPSIAPFEYEILHFKVEGLKGSMDWWLGKDREIDLCKECFDKFWQLKSEGKINEE